MKKLFLLIILLAPYVLASAQREKTQSIEVKGDYFQMKYVEGGSFTMGAPAGDQKAEADAKPAHKVTLSAFYIGEYEVTQRVWELVMGDNPSQFQSANPGNIFINVPVSNVSWSDCQVFIQKLNALTGCSFRLPTEAEWESGARGISIPGATSTGMWRLGVIGSSTVTLDRLQAGMAMNWAFTT